MSASNIIPPTQSSEYESSVLLLLKRMATGTSRVLGGMMDIPWDDDLDEVGGEFGAETNKYGSKAGMLSDLLFPSFSPVLKMMLPPITDSSDGLCDQASIQQCASSRAQNTPRQDGLVLSSPDVMERLDFVITQMDIARMERTASRRLDVENIHQLSTITYANNDDLICPPCDDVMEQDEVQEHEPPNLDNAQVWSWMVVPRDTKQSMSRIAGDVPESISICVSTGSGDYVMEPSFDHCVICREHFKEGELLRVLVIDILIVCYDPFLHHSSICSPTSFPISHVNIYFIPDASAPTRYKKPSLVVPCARNKLQGHHLLPLLWITQVRTLLIRLNPIVQMDLFQVGLS